MKMTINKTDFKKITTMILLIALIVLSFFLIKPVLMSIVIALILAFIFTPVYDLLYKYIRSKNIAAAIIVFFLILIIILPIWFLTPILIEQAFKIFQASEQVDFITPLKSIFPALFASEQFSSEIGSILSSFTSRVGDSVVNSLAQIIFNFPTISLQLLVVFFTFFFVLRDKKELVAYVKTLLPFSKDVEKKIFEHTKGITSSVLYGQVIVGIIQGIAAGLGFFIFGVPNALFLTLIASMAGIFPIIGTTIVWFPVAVYLFIGGNTFAAAGVVFFGLISSTVDNFLRPMIVSRRTKIHSAIILISMIGGLFLFGILGFILGPLIISYLLIVLEIYRNKQSPRVFIEQIEKKII